MDGATPHNPQSVRNSNERTPLEPFGPIWDTLFCRVGTASWQTTGLDTFSGTGVPFGATSDGNLSQAAVDVFLALVKDRPHNAKFRLIEIGAGTGLFAKLFLDTLRRDAPEIYSRTRILVTDGSPQLVDEQTQAGLFQNHPDTARCAALIAHGDWKTHPIIKDFLDGTDGFDAIFMTYLLDNLPFDVLAINNDTTWRLEGRTTIDHTAAGLDHAALSTLAREMTGANPVDQLYTHWPFLQVEAKHTQIAEHALPYPATITRPDDTTPVCFVHSYGAISLLDEAFASLRDGGAIFASDYGNTRAMAPAARFAIQAYDKSIATGINFFQLDTHYTTIQDRSYYIPQVQNSAVTSRLMVKGQHPGLQSEINAAYEDTENTAFETAVRAAVSNNDGVGVATAYEARLETQPHNWLRMQELGLVHLHLGDHVAAIDWAKASLAINPMAGKTWRVSACALFAIGDLEGALIDVGQAIRFDPTDADAYLLQARALQKSGQNAAALSSIANGLGHAVDNSITVNLVSLQETIVRHLSDRNAALRAMKKQPIAAVDTPANLNIK